MPSKRQTRLAEMRAIADREGWTRIDSSSWAKLCEGFAGVSEITLRHDIRELGIPADPLVEGVRLDSLAELQRSLLGLEACYRSAVNANPRDTMNPARRLVLAARRKAEMVIRGAGVDGGKRAAMEEKLLWIRTWLENPLLFASWAELRVKNPGNPDATQTHPSDEH